MNGVLHFETTSVERRLADFLDYQKLINNADEIDVEVDKITLMTLHTAKGNGVSSCDYYRDWRREHSRFGVAMNR